MNTDFDSIYANGGWNGLGSGPGSTPEFTKGFRKVLENLLDEKNITSVFEPGCGDWQWQSLVDWGERSYIGVDIVEKVIIKNAIWYPHLFAHADIFEIKRWPKADLMIVKDLVHHITQERVCALMDRALNYKCVLWVVDMEDETEDSEICNWPDGVWRGGMKLLYDFDLSVENYPFGRKAAFLQVN